MKHLRTLTILLMLLPAVAYADTAADALNRLTQYVDKSFASDFKRSRRYVVLAAREKSLGRLTSQMKKALKDLSQVSGYLDRAVADCKKNGVPETDARYKQAMVKVQKARDAIAKLDGQAKKVLAAAERGGDIANYPDFERDMAEFLRIAKRFRSFEGWDKDESKFEALRTFRPDEGFGLMDWYNERVKFYAWFLKANTQEAMALKKAQMECKNAIVVIESRVNSYTKNMAATADRKIKTITSMATRNKGKGFNDKLARKNLDAARTIHARLQRLRTDKNETVQKLAKDIQGAAAAIDKMAAAEKEAVAQERGAELLSALADAQAHAQKAFTDKNANWMKGAFSKLSRCQDGVARLKGIAAGHPKVSEVEKKLGEVEGSIKKMAQEMEETIIAGTRAPKDAYTGADKNKWASRIKDAWKKEYPKDEILGLRFHVANWKRTTELRYDKNREAWYKYDKSVLVTLVIVKTSDATASLFPAYVNVDHISKGEVIGVNTKGGSYIETKMLLKNLD